ncbi:unnamed protein product [Trichobilharzia szidati]|nr:unnamed protein product [Trichobilharzia szidati]
MLSTRFRERFDYYYRLLQDKFTQAYQYLNGQWMNNRRILLFIEPRFSAKFQVCFNFVLHISWLNVADWTSTSSSGTSG